METRFTTAPESYDGFGTRTLCRVEMPKRGPRGVYAVWYREVEIDPEYLDWQRVRYASGLHACLTNAELVMLHPLCHRCGVAACPDADAPECLPIEGRV